MDGKWKVVQYSAAAESAITLMANAIQLTFCAFSTNNRQLGTFYAALSGASWHILCVWSVEHRDTAHISFYTRAEPESMLGCHHLQVLVQSWKTSTNLSVGCDAEFYIHLCLQCIFRSVSVFCQEIKCIWKKNYCCLESAQERDLECVIALRENQGRSPWQWTLGWWC